VNSRALEIGMSGMRLVSDGMSSSGHGRKETGSTIASSPPDDREDLSSHAVSSNRDQLSLKGSAPTSPHSDKQQNVSKGFGRPPGLGAPSLPSPIAKPGHSKNSSATSPLLTLTPNSSVDGNSDWHSSGRQASPFHGEAPSMPFLNAEPRRGADDASAEAASFGSFDLAENDNDGLLGLEALRDRAQSSPGPIVTSFSNSPPIRGHFAAHESSQQRTRDRPPLSQSSYEGSSHHGDRSVGERSVGERSVGSMGNPFSREPNNMSMESSDSRLGFGAIARPELRQSASEFDPSRRRASSQDNFQAQYMAQQQQANVMFDQQSFSHKFGTLPSLSTHIQQQRMPQTLHESFGDLHKPRHVRSVSQPVPPGVPADARFIGGATHQVHTVQGETGYAMRQPGGSRHASMSQPVLSAYESQYAQKRVSMPNLSGAPAYANHPQLQRRDALEFHVSPGSQSSGSVMANAEEMRGFGPSASPGQSPHQVHYISSHSRQASDASHMSLPAGFRGPPMHRRHASSGGDDDLAHPLIGEHIDVPAEHGNDVGLRGAYMVNQSISGSHGHSMSLDQVPPQYMEVPHHLPTAGAALSMPKVVYTIKFKRSQRNFVLGPRINRDLKIGTYVKVEADRGEDLGIVIGKLPADKYNFPSRASFTAGMGPPAGGAADLKRIIRLATHDEVSLLSLKREEEEELLKVCRGKVRQRGLPMNVVDAEYQFDRHKLTFFFEAEGRVDFRELVRDLFSMYKTRIWMQQLDKNTSTASQAIMVPQAANLQMDYGTPIIAPASEFADSLVLGSLTGGDARSH